MYVVASPKGAVLSSAVAVVLVVVVVVFGAEAVAAALVELSPPNEKLLSKIIIAPVLLVFVLLFTKPKDDDSSDLKDSVPAPSPNNSCLDSSTLFLLVSDSSLTVGGLLPLDDVPDGVEMCTF